MKVSLSFTKTKWYHQMVDFRIPPYIKWGFLSLMVLIAAADSVIDYFHEAECKQNNLVVPAASVTGFGARPLFSTLSGYLTFLGLCF